MKRIKFANVKIKISILSLILILALIGGLAGCAKQEEKPAEATQPVETETAKEPEKVSEPETTPVQSDTVKIVDMAGRELTIPADIKTIATPNVDAFRILVQLGAADKLIGVPSNMYGSKYSDVDTIEVQSWPKVKELEKVGGGPPGTEINAEAIIALNPDVVISWSYGKRGNSIEMAEQIQKQSGIPVICLNSISNAKNAEKELETAYKLMGKIAGKEERAEELIAYYKSEVKNAQKLIEGAEPKKVYMSNPKSILNRASTYLPIKQLKLNDVTKDMGKKGREVSKEQLLAWNPDIIFMQTPSKVYRIDMNEIEKDPTLQNVKAIKDGEYYHVKAYFMGWDISTGLVDLYYMGKIAYPEQFKDLNMRQKGNEILKTFYNVDGLYENLEINNGFHKFDE